MKRTIQIGLLATLLWGPVYADDSHKDSVSCISLVDTVGDMVIRRTDPGNDGMLPAGATIPDILSVEVCAWEPFDPVSDPYTGQTVDSDGANIFKLEIVIGGFVNPPGHLFGANPDVFVFGPAPIVGFVDFDVDGQKNTGGELNGAAETRYLANVGRFGIRPNDSLGERIATSRADIDGDFFTAPQFERTGEDFALVLCGCDSPVIVSQSGNQDNIFDPGEDWIVRARFFERAQGYRDASAAFGGSAPGLYDPKVDLRFTHDIPTNTTTITLVFPLTMAGAAALAGQPEQPIDLNVGNQTSIAEGVQDIIDGADAGGIFGPAWELVRRWRGENVSEAENISEWTMTALFGMPYASTDEGIYAWTDTAGDETFGDLDGDGNVDTNDEDLIRQNVYQNDGQSSDADNSFDGVWTLINPGWNFSLYDLDGDMRVASEDLDILRPVGDYDRDGTVDIADFIAFLNDWASQDNQADLNLDQVVNTQDFIIFLNAWSAG